MALFQTSINNRNYSRRNEEHKNTERLAYLNQKRRALIGTFHLISSSLFSLFNITNIGDDRQQSNDESNFLS